MCGIFAYFGKSAEAPAIVIEGLKKLEYRGYDSWGIAYMTKASIIVHKEVGKISDSKNKKFVKSHIAMGHSRWATHGKVNKNNAHPHFSKKKEVFVVHNGIIENFLELKEELKKDKVKFISETDTEIIVHLIEKYLNWGPEIAFKKALARLEGRFAVVAFVQSERKIFAARKGSPLIVGIGKQELFLASDIPAFLEKTNQVSYLDDNEMLIIDEQGIVFKNFIKEIEVEKRVVKIEWEAEDAEKGDFDHFMIK